MIIKINKKNFQTMESSGKKSEMMKPILLKAGIPLAVSLAGFIYSMIISRRKLDVNSSSHETYSQEESRDQEGLHGPDSNTHVMDSLVSLKNRDKLELEEEILGLKCMISALQDREQEFKMRFIRFHDLKAQELVLMEYQNMLVLEIAHVEFLGMMVESMEEEKRRFKGMVAEFLRVVEQLKFTRSENGVLQVKVKKLLRTTRKRSHVVHQRALMLRAREDEILRSKEELEEKEQVIKELEDEIMELKRIIDQLQEEKNELEEKLEMGETSASSTLKMKAMETKTDDQDQLLIEIEQIRKDREAEVMELIYLQWINVSLRQELMREGKEEQTEYDLDGLSRISEHGVPSTAITTMSHKKVKLFHKLRRWVRGNKDQLSDGAVEHIDARKSCFSA